MARNQHIYKEITTAITIINIPPVINNIGKSTSDTGINIRSSGIDGITI
jgi:hypothetical protein